MARKLWRWNLSIEKRAPYRNKKLLAVAKMCPCMRCARIGNEFNPIEACHYTGPRSAALGKGKSQKPDDDCVAFLCRECHQVMDGYENGDDKWQRSEEFLYYVVLTMNLLHRIGFEF